MKKMMLWMLAALLTIGGASVFTACKDGDEGGGTKENRKAKKALLIILDGWGIGDKGQGDVIAQTATPYTTHSTNPVPFIYVTANKNATVQSGILADVAPSVLHIMGLHQPKEMTGQCLIKE